MNTEKEWVEPIVKAEMAHKQSDDKYHWTACVCCGRALYQLAPKLVERAEKEQKKRDWEEFGEMVQSYPVAWVDEAHVIDGLTEKIDARLAELNKPKE